MVHYFTTTEEAIVTEHKEVQWVSIPAMAVGDTSSEPIGTAVLLLDMQQPLRLMEQVWSS